MAWSISVQYCSIELKSPEETICAHLDMIQMKLVINSACQPLLMLAASAVQGEESQYKLAS